MNNSGERVNDFNFCVSNPETIKIVANRGAELADLL